MLKNRLIAGFAAILLAYHGALRAESDTPAVSESSNPSDVDTEISSESIIIDGDKLELQLDRKMRSLGNASITRGDGTVFADSIEYDVQNDEVLAKGNVIINMGGTKLSGPEMRMQLSESVGEMKEASIIVDNPIASVKKPQPGVNSMALSRSLGNDPYAQSDETLSTSSFSGYDTGNMYDNNGRFITANRAKNARGDAKAIFFEGENKKRLEDARFTTCAAGKDDWYIKASEISLNDYTDTGTAKNAHIEFKGVPILYTPYISFSFNNQRKSGFLAPTVGTTSRSGFEVLTPYYWNIAPNKDATIAARALSKRGIQFQGELRYLEENYSGTSNVEYLPSDLTNNEDRYFVNLKHRHGFAKGWSAGYNIEKVSDDQYFSELSTRIVTTSRINLPQQFNLDFNNDVWRFNAIAQKFQTLSVDPNIYPYERLPQLTLEGNKFYGDLNAKLYTHLVSFDTSNNDPRNGIRTTGTRFTLYPSITMPINRSYGYITPKIGVHHTTYSLNNIANDLESQQRTLPIFSLDSGLFFDRDFKIADRGYSQTIEPRLFYVYIPNRKQDNIPLFDTALTDLNFSSLFTENQFVGNDRINNANQVSFALTTRFIENSTGEQRLSASIGQRYYFSDQQVLIPNSFNTINSRSNSSDIIAGLSGRLKNSWTIDGFWQYNTDDSSSVRSTITGRYNPEPGKTLNLSYSYRQDAIDQVDLSSQWPMGQGFYGIGRVNYSFRENRLIETIAGLEYDAGCWQARGVLQRVTTATADANYALFFQLELGGLASIGANPLRVIQRNIPGYMNTGLIPDNIQQPYYE